MTTNIPFQIQPLSCTMWPIVGCDRTQVSRICFHPRSSMVLTHDSPYFLLPSNASAYSSSEMVPLLIPELENESLRLCLLRILSVFCPVSSSSSAVWRESPACRRADCINMTQDCLSRSIELRATAQCTLRHLRKHSFGEWPSLSRASISRPERLAAASMSNISVLACKAARWRMFRLLWFDMPTFSTYSRERVRAK